MDNKLSILKNNKLEIKSTKIVKFIGNTFKDITPVVLFDISGSMNQNDCQNNERRIDIINKISKKMLNFPIYAFNYHVKKIENSILYADGSTNLIEALEICKVYQKVILVSDGCPDNSNEAMIKALSLKIPFDTILIGNDSSGKIFMQELSKRSGGNFSTVETSDLLLQEKLETGINKLLLYEKI